MWVARSTTFIGRRAGVVRKLGGASGSSDGMPLAYTPRSFQAGMWLWTASSRPISPSSTSIISATAVIGLLIE